MVTVIREVSRECSEGKRQEKGGAYPFGRLEPDVATVPLDQLAADKQTESGAGNLVVVYVTRPREPLEHLPLLLSRYANPTILNAQLRQRGLSVRSHGDRNWPALWTVLDGVAQEIPKYLLQPHAVSLQQHGVDLVISDHHGGLVQAVRVQFPGARLSEMPNAPVRQYR
jgi:hypothetical protein